MQQTCKTAVFKETHCKPTGRKMDRLLFLLIFGVVILGCCLASENGKQMASATGDLGLGGDREVP